jgi:hypothetical protein
MIAISITAEAYEAIKQRCPRPPTPFLRSRTIAASSESGSIVRSSTD